MPRNQSNDTPLTPLDPQLKPFFPEAQSAINDWLDFHDASIRMKTPRSLESISKLSGIPLVTLKRHSARRHK